MPRPITAIGFRGMNNLPRAPGILLDDAKRITPRIALNVEVTDGGKLVRRKGYGLAIPLPGAHSLWAGSVMLVAADGKLYRIEGTGITIIGIITGPRALVCYQELDNLIYMATPTWGAVYDLLGGLIRPWGLSLPPAPVISIVAGDMPPGTYTLCYTRSEGSRLSGNGPLTQVSWEGGTQGILLGNLPAGGQCWITHPNGADLFLATVVSGVVSGQAPKIGLLPSFAVAPPMGLSHFAQAFGRIWGCAGRKLIYSDSFQYEWFRTPNFKPFLEDLIMVAPVNEGLFVNSRESTWFLEGTDPAKMEMKRIGDGALPGTLTYAYARGSHLETARTVFEMPSPFWMSKNGIIAGTHTGKLMYLTKSRLLIPPKMQGAAIYQVKEGVPQVIMALSGGNGGGGPELSSIFDLGTL